MEAWITAIQHILAWNFDPHTIGYEWNEDACQIYQCHYPEGWDIRC